MIEFWPFWLGGLALAGVALGHWFLTGRLMAVSGRFSRLVDMFRFGEDEVASEPIPEEDLMAMLLAATEEEFGAAALAEEQASSAAAETGPGEVPVAEAGGSSEVSPAVSASAQPWWFHLAFFLALTAGGAISALLAGAWDPRFALRGEVFASVFGGGLKSLWPLALGGFLVGLGTRMAGGCTSGHGLCGVSRVQKGSLLATASFFGAGIAVSLLVKGVTS